MKKSYIIFILILIFTSCDDSRDIRQLSALEKLPPKTITGANTFGCLLNGEAYIPGKSANPLDCVYQLVDEEYYFALQSNKRDSNHFLIGLAIGTERLQLVEGEIYPIRNLSDGNAYAVYTFGIFQNFTSEISQGQLVITKLDMQNHIVSGTFWFDVIDSLGKLHRITEGRFDMKFTT